MSLGPNLIPSGASGFETLESPPFWLYQNNGARINDIPMTGDWYGRVRITDGSPAFSVRILHDIANYDLFSGGVLYQIDIQVLFIGVGQMIFFAAGNPYKTFNSAYDGFFSDQFTFGGGPNVLKFFATGQPTIMAIDEVQVREVLALAHVGGTLVNGILVNRGLVA